MTIRRTPSTPTEEHERPYQQRIGENAVLRTHRFEVREVEHPFHTPKTVFGKGQGIYVRGIDSQCERCREDKAALERALETLLARVRAGRRDS